MKNLRDFDAWILQVKRVLLSTQPLSRISDAHTNSLTDATNQRLEAFVFGGS